MKEAGQRWQQTMPVKYGGQSQPASNAAVGWSKSVANPQHIHFKVIFYTLIPTDDGRVQNVDEESEISKKVLHNVSMPELLVAVPASTFRQHRSITRLYDSSSVLQPRKLYERMVVTEPGAGSPRGRNGLAYTGCRALTRRQPCRERAR